MPDIRPALQEAWLTKGLIARVLWPVSLIYGALVWLRKLLYRLDVFHGQHLPVPVIVVGNVFVGGVGKTPLVIALVNWVQTARVIYTETTALAARDFIAAQRALGAGTARILGRHILPHLVPIIIVWGTLGISTTVLLEATLSYLGVGVQPPTPSWGNIIFENQTYFQSAPWLVFIPGFAIVVLALAFNLVGDALRDVLDPTLRGSE
jgi:peptide/nickel transport system permease protein